MMKMSKNKPSNRSTIGTPKVIRDAAGRFVKGGAVANPAGRPADGESWAGVYKHYGEMTPSQLAEQVGGIKSELGQRLLQMKNTNVPLKHIVVINAFMAAANDPQPGILKEIADRAEGKVLDKSEVRQEITIDGFPEILQTVYGKKE